MKKKIARLQEASAELTTTLSSLDLPASIEDKPWLYFAQTLRDISKDVHQKGGIEKLRSLIGELPILSRRNLELLNEIERSIKDEEKRDQERRDLFGKSKWNITPSSSLNKAMKDFVNRYRNYIKHVQAGDEKAKQSFNYYRRYILFLSGDCKEAIVKLIPPDYQGHNYSNSPTVQKLKELMREVDDLKQARHQLETKLKKLESINSLDYVDWTSIKMIYNERKFTVEALADFFEGIQEEFRKSLARQETLIKAIKSANQDFIKLKRASQLEDCKRDAVFICTVDAYDSFNKQLIYLQEATKYYNCAIQLLVSLQTKVDDFCYNRKIARERLSKTLDPSGTQAMLSFGPTRATLKAAKKIGGFFKVARSGKAVS